MIHYTFALFVRVLGLDAGGEGGFSLGKWALSGVTAWVWAAWGIHVQQFLISPIFFAVTMMWAGDWTLGSALAWKERRYSPRRGTYSIVKLLIWWAALAASWSFRLDGLPFDDMIPYLVAATICWTEFISILRNAARFLGRTQGVLLSRLADNLEGEVDWRFQQWERAIHSRKTGEKQNPQVTREALPGGSGVVEGENPGEGLRG